MENRETIQDDYLAMLRRRIKVILILRFSRAGRDFWSPMLFPAKYTSQSLVLVEVQKVPEGIVQPVVTEDLNARIATLEQQVLSQSSLQPMLERTGLAKPGQNMGRGHRQHPAQHVGRAGARRPRGDRRQEEARQSTPVPGFYVELHRIERARGPADLQRADVASAGGEPEIARKTWLAAPLTFSASKSRYQAQSR